jgi:AmmeMemoRadiSam system protein A
MTPDAGTVLLPIARAEIARPLGAFAPAREDAPWLGEPGATFVTLKKNGALRGCIGSLEARRPLLVDLKSNAVAAAFRDPRFPPLSHEELDEIRIEVSLLSPLAAIEFESEVEALARLRPFEDGIVLEYGARRGTFLPQVWEDLPEPAQFLGELKRKAGLSASFWSDGVRLFRYSVAKYIEAETAAIAPMSA